MGTLAKQTKNSGMASQEVINEKNGESNDWLEEYAKSHPSVQAETTRRREAAIKEQQSKIDKAKSKGKDTTELEAGLERLQMSKPTYYQDLSDEELVAKRNAATGEQRQKYQEEINRRDSDGQPHSWTQADKELVAKREEAAKQAEAPVQEETPTEEGTESKTGGTASELAGAAEVIQKTPEEIEAEEKERKKKERKEKSAKFWNGDEEKYKKFLSSSNPNLVKMIFGNSGASFGDRMAGLGEMLASITANTANGIYAGVNKTGFTPVQGRMSKIYSKAAEDQYNRTKGVLDTENKAKMDKANRLSMLKSSNILKGLPEGMLDELADKMVTGLTAAEKDKYKYDLLQSGKSEREIEEIMNTFESMRNTFSDVTAQRANVVELNGKEFDLMRKPQEAISELQKTIASLEAQKLEVANMSYDKLADFMGKFKSTYAGIISVSASMSENKEFNYNASTSVKGGIPVIRGSVEGGVSGGNGSSKTAGSQADQLALQGLSEGKITAQQWNKETQKYRDSIIASLDAAIEEARSQIATLKKFHSMDDGIAKAPHMKQWLVREDGTKIKLNPNDTVYATTKKITTAKDNGQDIVQMKPEDKAVVMQKKLGHSEGNINKDFNYYFTKLK